MHPYPDGTVTLRCYGIPDHKAQYESKENNKASSALLSRELAHYVQDYKRSMDVACRKQKHKRNKAVSFQHKKVDYH